MLISLLLLLLGSVGAAFTAALQQLRLSQRAAHAMRNVDANGVAVVAAEPTRTEPLASVLAARVPLLEMIGQSGLAVAAFSQAVEELSGAVSDFQASQRNSGIQIRSAYAAGAAQFEREIAEVSSQGINLAMALANQSDTATTLEACDCLNASIQALDAQLGAFLQSQSQRLESATSRTGTQIEDSRSKLQLLASRLRQQLDAMATQLEAHAEPAATSKRRGGSGKEIKDTVRIANGK